MINVPNLTAALVDAARRVKDPWNSFFQQFSQAPSKVLDIDVGTSPFAYMAKEPGYIHINSGTVSAISFTRGVNTLAIASGLVNSLIPVQIGDIIGITYSVLPTVTFVPNYTSRRNS